MSRIVGIDYGIARIGVAISDASRLIASPFATVAAARKPEESARAVWHRTQGQACDLFVVGMPLHMNGKIGDFAQQAQQFAVLLQQICGIETIVWDERLTTVMAERTMRQANLSRKKRVKIVDAMAAVIILQSYLDFLQQQALHKL